MQRGTAFLLFRHSGFDILQLSWDGSGKILASVLRHKAVILQAESDPAVLIVNADINAEHYAGCDGMRHIHIVMHIKADMMRTAVPAVWSTEAIGMPGLIMENMYSEVR